MRKYFIPAITLAAVAGVALAGCQKVPSNDNRNAPSSPTQQMRQGAQQFGQGAAAMATHAGNQAGQAASDTAITAKVKAALAAKNGLSSMDIHVTTESGVVTLTGTVSSNAQKDLAASVTGQVSGVQSVNNQLEVKPGS